MSDSIPPFYKCSPMLARALETNAAIVVERLLWLQSQPQNGREIDGEQWLFNTLEAWSCEHFVHLSAHGVRKVFAKLKQRGVLRTKQPDGYHRLTYYRINEDAVTAIAARELQAWEDVKSTMRPKVANGDDHASQSGASNRPKVPNGSVPKCQIDASQSGESVSSSENPTSTASGSTTSTLPQPSASENGVDELSLEPSILNQPKPDGFDRFWNAYPKKDKKADAQKAWKKHKCSKLIDVILPQLELAKQTEQWTKEGGKYIPAAVKWINGRRWEDDIKPAPTNGANLFQGTRHEKDAAIHRAKGKFF